MSTKFVSQSSYGRSAHEFVFPALKVVLQKGYSHEMWSRKGWIQHCLPQLPVPFLLFKSIDNGRGVISQSIGAHMVPRYDIKYSILSGPSWWCLDLVQLAPWVSALFFMVLGLCWPRWKYLYRNYGKKMK